MRRYIVTIVVALFVLLSVVPLSAQTVTEDILFNLVKKNISEQNIVKAISMAKEVKVDTSFENTVALMDKGLSQTIVNAVVERKKQLNPESAVAAPTMTAQVVPTPNGSANTSNKPGVYVETANGLAPLPLELAGVKSQGIFGSMKTGMSAGLSKSKIKGQVKGARSSAQYQKPVTLVLIGEEFPLVSFETGKDRKFVTASLGLTGSSNLEDSYLQVKTEKIGPKTYKLVLSDLPAGEYGFIATQTPSGYKLYTFGIYDGAGSSLAQR